MIAHALYEEAYGLRPVSSVSVGLLGGLTCLFIYCLLFTEHPPECGASGVGRECNDRCSGDRDGGRRRGWGVWYDDTLQGYPTTLVPLPSLASVGGDFSGSLGIPLRVRSIAQAASGSHPSSLVCDVRAISYIGSTPVVPCSPVSKSSGGEP